MYKLNKLFNLELLLGFNMMDINEEIRNSYVCPTGIRIVFCSFYVTFKHYIINYWPRIINDTKMLHISIKHLTSLGQNDKIHTITRNEFEQFFSINERGVLKLKPDTESTPFKFVNDILKFFQD